MPYEQPIFKPEDPEEERRAMLREEVIEGALVMLQGEIGGEAEEAGTEQRQSFADSRIARRSGHMKMLLESLYDSNHDLFESTTSGAPELVKLYESEKEKELRK